MVAAITVACDEADYAKGTYHGEKTTEVAGKIDRTVDGAHGDLLCQTHLKSDRVLKPVQVLHLAARHLHKSVTLKVVLSKAAPHVTVVQ